MKDAASGVYVNNVIHKIGRRVDHKMQFSFLAFWQLFKVPYLPECSLTRKNTVSNIDLDVGSCIDHFLPIFYNTFPRGPQHRGDDLNPVYCAHSRQSAGVVAGGAVSQKKGWPATSLLQL